MVLESVAEYQILAEDIEGLMPAEPLELGRMDAALHAGCQGAALKTVAGEVVPTQAYGNGAPLDDVRDRA